MEISRDKFAPRAALSNDISSPNESEEEEEEEDRFLFLVGGLVPQFGIQFFLSDLDFFKRL